MRVAGLAWAIASCVFLHEANKITGTTCSNIPQWNDRSDRTLEQVNLAYANAIKRLENSELCDENLKVIRD